MSNVLARAAVVSFVAESPAIAITETLLPINREETEEILEKIAAVRLDAILVPLKTLMSPDDIQKDLLPWLAWALDTLEWRSDYPDAQARLAILASINVHNILGTPAAVIKGLELIGFLDVVVIEFNHYLDGTWDLDGSMLMNGAYHFDVQLGDISNLPPQVISKILRVIGTFKNERSRLRNLLISALVLDGTWILDNSNNLHGGFV